jgi:D-alanyl-D-alanine dipeptidase
MSSRPVIDVSPLPKFAVGHKGLIWRGTTGFKVIEGSMFVMALIVYIDLRLQVEQWQPSLPNPDIRYATADNFVGKTVYPEARAFLQRPAAEALLRVHKKLKKQKLGLVIFDGYRPWSITKLFWEVTPEDKRKFVANPKNGSKHNRGCAVDLSIYDLRTGKLVEMPSGFDEFTERASPDYKGATSQETANREMLRRMMEAEGFTVNPNEWWHFDYKNWQDYAIYDVSFEDAEREN